MSISDRDGLVDGLGQADVERLLHDRSADTRAETARKVATAFSAGALGPNERAIGEEIFRAMMRDAAVRVRQALAENLKQSKDLPHDVAVALARDVEEVSLPMLEGSAVLTDDDLITLIDRLGDKGKLAIARRQTVSKPVVEKLVETSDAPVVATVFANPGAELTETAIEWALDKTGNNEAVQTALVHRAQLPVTIAERLVAVVSDKLRDYLVTHHELAAGTAADLILESRERATVGLLPPGVEGGNDVDGLVEQLHVNSRLTPTLILRALCLGDIPFFESSIARLSQVTVVNARMLIHDAGPLGLKAIYERAKLPAGLFQAFRIAFDAAREAQYDGGEHDRERLVRRVLERILTQADAFEPDDLDYLLRKLYQYANAA